MGELYDHVLPYAGRADVGFYADEAAACGGSVLEAGCGTGRVLLPIARRGVSITGIDQSPLMLDRCRQRLSDEPEDVRRRVKLHQADMCDFDLGETFALAIVPFRPMQHLLTIGDQLSTLRAIHRHLDPSGRLIFDLFNPNIKRLAAGPSEESQDMTEITLPDGSSFHRTDRVKALHIVEQISEAELTYYVTMPGGETERRVHAFEMRWYWRFEVEHLLERAGFALEAVYGNFDRSALTDDSPEMIFVAEQR
jgi:SAM-dependent methyltransferase